MNSQHDNTDNNTTREEEKTQLVKKAKFRERDGIKCGEFVWWCAYCGSGKDIYIVLCAELSTSTIAKQVSWWQRRGTAPKHSTAQSTIPSMWFWRKMCVCVHLVDENYIHLNWHTLSVFWSLSATSVLHSIRPKTKMTKDDVNAVVVAYNATKSMEREHKQRKRQIHC